MKGKHSRLPPHGNPVICVLVNTHTHGHSHAGACISMFTTHACHTYIPTPMSSVNLYWVPAVNRLHTWYVPWHIKNSIIILIKSEHGLASNVSSSWSHYRFIFVRCQSILIHLSSFVCVWFEHMNLACDFKLPYGDLLSRKHVHQSFVSAFPCSDRIWGVFSDPLQSLWLGVTL